MHIPHLLRQQLKLYERAGFHAIDIKPRKGSHVQIRFKEFKQFVIVSRNLKDPHALLNNIAMFKTFAKENEDGLDGV